MKIFLSKKCLKKILREADRWYMIGMQEEKQAYECVVYPLSYTKLRSEKSPVEPITLDDIECVAVTNAAIPQDDIKNYGPAFANFDKKGIDIEKGKRDFNSWKIKPVIMRFPLLEQISRLHTHPFTTEAKHSCGDLDTIQKDEIRARSQGYAVSFSFILTVAKKEPLEWQINCFSVDGSGSEVQHEITIVSHRNRLMKEARRQPFYNGPRGKKWEEAMEEYCKRFTKYGKVRKSRGWTCWWLMNPKENVMLLVPPFFPEGNAQAYFSADGIKWQKVEEPFVRKWLDQLNLGILTAKEE